MSSLAKLTVPWNEVRVGDHLDHYGDRDPILIHDIQPYIGTIFTPDEAAIAWCKGRAFMTLCGDRVRIWRAAR